MTNGDYCVPGNAVPTVKTRKLCYSKDDRAMRAI